jgi:hypothetical protein
MRSILGRWCARRAAARHQVEADAQRLIARFGILAYDVARERDWQVRHGVVHDLARGADHWSRVRRRIAALTGHTIGFETAGRWEN